MKRILHVAEPFTSGVLSFLRDITQRQVEEYEVYILYGVRPLTPPDVESLFDKRVRLIKSRCFRGALGTVLNPLAYGEVRKWFKRIEPDIVHLHSSASGFVGRWALRQDESILHAPWIFVPDAGCFGDEKAAVLAGGMAVSQASRHDHRLRQGGGELEKELTAPNIKVTGWLTREEALSVSREADLFLLPSLWEGLPISLLEAMYLKKVCLVSDVIGNRDVIHTGVNGFICEQDEDCAQVIRGIKDGKMDLQTIKENAHEDVARNYNAERIAERYDEIYNQ